MKLIRLSFVILACSLVLIGCKKPSSTNSPNLVFKFVFDSTQARLDNFGNPASMPAGHAGQCPQMNVMAAHYIELSTGDSVPLGKGLILYKTAMTLAGGGTDSAIQFSQEVQTQNGGTFFSTPLKNVTPGVYQYLRVSLAYQNYTVQMYIDSNFSYGVYNININQLFPSTIASFIGVDTYIPSFTIKDSSRTVNGNRLQGFWGFETPVDVNYGGVNYNYTFVDSGQAPFDSTTVVNPLFATSPIVPGSCVVTAAFNGGSLTITGKETSDIVITVSLSTNKSFEWIDVVPDGQWEPLKGETIVNMGIRGMIPYIQN